MSYYSYIYDSYRLIKKLLLLKRIISEIFLGPCNSNPCQNDGTCSHDENGFHCACVSEFTGTSCEIGTLLTYY